MIPVQICGPSHEGQDFRRYFLGDTDSWDDMTGCPSVVARLSNKLSSKVFSNRALKPPTVLRRHIAHCLAYGLLSEKAPKAE